MSYNSQKDELSYESPEDHIDLLPSDKQEITSLSTSQTTPKESDVASMKEIPMSVKEVLIDVRDILRPKGPKPRGAAKFYKEVTVLELEGEESYKITLDQMLEDVGSVVLVSMDGPLLIRRFSTDGKNLKEFSKGQEAMEGDWVKLDAPSEGLKTIELKIFSEQRNRLKIYVQHFDQE